MAIKTKFCIAIFLFFFLITLAISREETDPELKTCKHQCQQQRQYDEHDKRICMKECDEYHQMKEEREKSKEDTDDDDDDDKEDENPYVFEYKDFDTILDTEDGRISILNMFDQKSKLLRNVENYGLAVLEAKAHTFVSPHHFDSEVVFFIIKGMYYIWNSFSSYNLLFLE
jgi:hypothetical protein